MTEERYRWLPGYGNLLSQRISLDLDYRF